MHETIFFVKKPKFLSITFNLRVEQNLVHLGRFLHFSQKVVVVTLRVGKKDCVNEHRNIAEGIISQELKSLSLFPL